MTKNAVQRPAFIMDGDTVKIFQKSSLSEQYCYRRKVFMRVKMPKKRRIGKERKIKALIGNFQNFVFIFSDLKIVN